MNRLRLAGLCVATCALSLTGCSAFTDDPAQEAADKLAAALAEHSLDGIPMTSETDRDMYATAIGSVADASVDVEATDVTTEDHTARVTLSWTWDLDGATWEYSTRASLEDAAGSWELDWSPQTLAPGLRSGERLDIDHVAGARGQILGSGGTALVTDRPVIRYGLDKSDVKPRQWRESASRIARALRIDASGYQDLVTAYGDKAFVEAIVLRTEEARTRIPVSYGDIPGATAIDDEIPLAPTKEFAAPILGSVGPATAEIIEASDGKITEGDQVGLSGLQSRYDDLLGASSGVRVQAVETDGESRNLFRQGVHDGQDLRTTLDAHLQLKGEEVLADHVTSQGPDSALVAIRPSTGEVLAAANGPANDGFNAATAGQYAPGSTFKVVTALALLRSGMTPEDVVDCDATTLVDGRSFKNYDDYPSAQIGQITLRQAIAHSCNTGLIASRDVLDPNTLGQSASALGLGVDHDLGFPAYFGQAPEATGETEEAANLIGQGTVLASPLAMAAVAASVEAGHAVLPVLLSDHRVEQSPPPTPLTEDESAQVQELVRAVVTEGSASFLADLPDEVGAKTGTAEYGQPDADGELATHTWMIATQGDLAVAVFVETGESGSRTAGPILEDFLR